MSRWFVCGIAAILGFGAARASLAQESSGPPVLQTGDGGAHATPSVGVLLRPVSLTVTQVSLSDALDALGAAAHVHISYSPSQLPVGKLVSLHAERLSLREALSAVLDGTGLDYDISSTGRIRVRVAGTAPLFAMGAQQGTATISGVVADSGTGASIPQMLIRVDGTTLETKSGSDGVYKIAGVPSGDYRVTARRVGYIAKTHTITLTEGQAAKLDFGLNPPATKLDEVVTTAVGEQRRYQVGNTISSINVDSLAPTAPVMSVTDVLTSRVPGLLVLENGGLVGSGESIRIGGISSLLLSNDPIIIVDGIRVDNSPGGTTSPILSISQVPSPSRINDIDVSQIATIDVLKGPAATTEYGTDAANGVIIITTKQGTNGKPQWHMSAEQDESTIPTGSFADYYAAWGHTTDGNNTLIQCDLDPVLYNTSVGSTQGGCLVDSITHFNPLNNAATTIYRSAPTTKYDLSVSGGTDAMRYSVAGDLYNQIGAISLPPVLRSEALAIGFPASSFQPNAENQRSIRVNSYYRLGATMDLQVTGAYMSTYQEEPGGSFINGVPAEIGGQLPYYAEINNATYCYGWCSKFASIGSSQSNFAFSPIASLGSQANQQANVLTGGLTWNWTPQTWVKLNTVLGIDHEGIEQQSQILPQSALLASADSNDGSYSLSLATTDIYTVNVRGTVTAALTHALRAVTSVGINMTDTRGVNLQGYTSDQLGATNVSLDGATSPEVLQGDDYSATLGGYIDEQLQIADRLFLDGSFRGDAGSGFGNSYSFQPYYGAQFSWIAVNTGPTTIRVHGSVGESGIQPSNGMSLQLYTTGTAWLNGQPVSTNMITAAGNPNLQPERSTEYDGGVDVSLWNSRLTLGASEHEKTTYQTIVSQSLGWTLYDNASVYENLGTVRNAYTEISATATPVRTRDVTWTVAVNGTLTQESKLLSFANGFTQRKLYTGGEGIYQVGYPLDAYFSETTAFTDVNHDGIAESNEITEGKSEYDGPAEPNSTASLQTSLSVFRDLTLSMVLDYRGDYKEVNDYAYEDGGAVGTLEGEVVPTAPLWQQVAAFTESGSQLSYEDGTELRLREIGVTYALPTRWARGVRLNTLSLTGSVRNVALWTRFSGGDPETSDESTTGDARLIGASTVPLSHLWIVRMNIGL